MKINTDNFTIVKISTSKYLKFLNIDFALRMVSDCFSVYRRQSFFEETILNSPKQLNYLVCRIPRGHIHINIKGLNFGEILKEPEKEIKEVIEELMNHGYFHQDEPKGN